MKHNITRLTLFAALVATTLTVAVSAHAQTVTTYNTPGFFNFTVPTGVTSATVSVSGSGGGTGSGNTAGGAGGRVNATLSGLTPGTTLRVIVGAGVGDGVLANGSGGLGTDFRTYGGELSGITLTSSSTNLSALNFLIIGGGGDGTFQDGAMGGTGGGLNGTAGSGSGSGGAGRKWRPTTPVMLAVSATRHRVRL